MSFKNVDVEDAVRVLKRLRADMHETREVSLVKAMDEVIQHLEMESGRSPTVRASFVSNALARGITLHALFKMLETWFD